MSKMIIKNGKVILKDKIINNASIIITDGIITEILENKTDISEKGIEVIDAKGNYISPGFIDTHTHGAGGADFMDATIEAYLTIAETHAKYGTTALTPTTLTCTDEELFVMFDVYKEAQNKNTKGAKFVGIHLEGPYFSKVKKGAQDPEYLKVPNDPSHYMNILSKTEDIVKWSIAPELEGALDLARILKEKGIVASVAHTEATTEDVIAAHKAGFSCLTHFYSAMNSISRKNSYKFTGPVEAGYLLDDMYVEVIADGYHLPKALLQLIYKVKGVDRIALITDSMRGAGMPNGVYKLGSLKNGQDVYVEDGIAKLMDKSAFAGSVATTNRLIQVMTELAEVSLVDTVRMASLTPARSINIDKKKGSIEVGKDADIIIFDSQIDIKATIVEGNCVYKA